MICNSRMLLFVILLFAASAQIFANPGDLDTSFDGDGIVITDSGAAFQNIADIAVQPDGKIIAVGFGEVVRYNANGSLDLTFGTGGIVSVSPGSLSSVALQPDGKIVIGGSQVVGSTGESPISDFFVGRLNSNGSLDTTFNGTGTLVLDLRSGKHDVGYSVKIQPDGKIVLGGNSQQFQVGPRDYAIVRFNSNGSLDTSFDGDGKVFTAMSNFGQQQFFGKIALTADGKILATGAAYLEQEGGFAVATVCYNSDGSLNTDFDGDGMVFTRAAFEDNYGNSIAVQPDGKIVVAGRQRFNLQADRTFLVRYNPNGSLDSSFGTGGKTTPSGGVASDVEIQADNKIVFVATFSFSQNNESGTSGYVGRLNANGSPDTSFHSDGFNAIPLTMPTRHRANAVALQSNGKILLGGTVGVGTNDPKDMLLARFENACTVNCGTRIADFDGDGKTDISTFRPGSGEWWIKRSASSVIVYQFGASTDKIVPGDYTGDGKADVAVWRPSTGEWFILRSEDNSYYAFPFGISGDVPAPADFDADGKTDPAVFRPSNGVWYLFLSSTGFTDIQFGISGDVPVAADYDGDTKADVAIFRPSNGEWWLRRSTAGVIAYTFGGSTDKPIQGDYTGDGKADVAFWRPSTAEWFILRSENATYYSFTWGIIGDTPSPGDYDGDGKFDPTVFRSSNATWWVNGSNSGIQTTNFGAPGDMPVPSAFVP